MSKNDLMPDIPEKVNETTAMGTPEFISSFNGWASGVRSYMGQTQYQQSLQPYNLATNKSTSDHSSVLTGLEKQMSDYTFRVVMPATGKVCYVGRRLLSMRKGDDGLIINSSPVVVVYYVPSENYYSCIEIPMFHSAQETFGFKYQHTQVAKDLIQYGTKRVTRIQEGTVLAYSPSIDPENGLYRNGNSFKVANLGLAGSSEDGMILSESALRRASPVGMGTSRTGWGQSTYPLNMYGTLENFQAHPTVGQRLRDDNIVFCTRTSDLDLDAIMMLPEALMEYDLTDSRVHAKGECKNAIVHDVKIFNVSNETGRNQNTPDEMVELDREITLQQTRFSEDLIKFYESVTSTQKKPTLSPELEHLIVIALGDKPNAPNRQPPRGSKIKQTQNIKRVMKGKPLDEWVIDIEYHWQWELGYGAKLGDGYGCKGTVCQILPDEDMPVDIYGNRADMVQFGSAIVARLIGAPEVERIVKSSKNTLNKEIRKLESMGFDMQDKTLIEFLQLVGLDHLKVYLELTDAEKRESIQFIVDQGLSLYLPGDNNYVNKYTINAMIERFTPERSKVKYKLYGREFTSDRPVLIAEKQIRFLEKSHHHPMSVGISRTQHHGLPATSNSSTKYSSAIVKHALRGPGETETRSYLHTIGIDPVSSVIDLASNPEVIKHTSALRFNDPNIASRRGLVDRKIHPKGQNRAMQFIINLLNCQGIDIN